MDATTTTTIATATTTTAHVVKRKEDKLFTAVGISTDKDGVVKLRTGSNATKRAISLRDDADNKHIIMWDMGKGMLMADIRAMLVDDARMKADWKEQYAALLSVYTVEQIASACSTAKASASTKASATTQLIVL